jgi:predicted ArsR family transcriptional regulator
LPARVRELAVFQDEIGYLAEAVVVEDGVVRLIQHNCAIHHVAKDQPAVCQAELDLFRGLMGVDVERETHIASGDRCCTYRFTDGAAGPPARAEREAPSGAERGPERPS